jgi:hypothetical protein
MVTRSLHHLDLGHSLMLNWVLVLVGALLAWLFWPTTFP